MGIQIDALPTTNIPSRDHVVPAMRDNQTYQLSVEQILELAEALDADYTPTAPLTATNVQAALDQLLALQQAVGTKALRADLAQTFSAAELEQLRKNGLLERLRTNYVALAAGATIPSVQSGLSYNLAGPGVQTCYLPAKGNVYAGWCCYVRMTGKPSGFQTAWVSAQAGETIGYREFAAAQVHHMIGYGEVFKFTCLDAAAGLWLAECVGQPSAVETRLSQSTGASYVAAPAGFTRLDLNTSTEAWAAITTNYVQVPCAGEWAITARLLAGSFTAAQGITAVIGDSGAPFVNAIAERQYLQMTSDYKYLNPRYHSVFPTTQAFSCWFQRDGAGAQYLPQSSWLTLTLTGR